ncbi:MAG: ATP/GTP-binding protein [Kineosporiaceae bacterium]
MAAHVTVDGADGSRLSRAPLPDPAGRHSRGYVVRPPSRTSMKVVVAGAFAAGKTTFIHTVADRDVISTETVTSEDGDRKPATTAAMDFGRFAVADGPEGTVELLLFGIPGQARFEFMWRILGHGALGCVLLVDAGDPSTWPEAAVIDSVLAAGPGMPRVVAVNRAAPGQDLTGIREALGIGPTVPVVACDPRQRSASVHVLITLFMEIIRYRQAGDDAAAPGPLVAPERRA